MSQATATKGNLLFFPGVGPDAGKIQCIYCHSWIDDDALFCAKCGNKVKAEKKQKYVPKYKRTKVPLKNIDDIVAMQNYLGKATGTTAHKKRVAYRNFIVFSLGISIGLRSIDLLRLKVSNFFDEKMVALPTAYVIEQKTGKGRSILIDERVSAMLKKYAEDLGLSHNDYIAWSQRPQANGEKYISPKSWNEIIGDAAAALGWNKLLYGGHTIRKTYAYQFYTQANSISRERGYRALSVLCRELNHSSEAVTLCYIGIDKEEVQEICQLTISQYNLAFAEANGMEESEE